MWHYTKLETETIRCREMYKFVIEEGILQKLTAARDIL